MLFNVILCNLICVIRVTNSITFTYRILSKVYKRMHLKSFFSQKSNKLRFRKYMNLRKINVGLKIGTIQQGQAPYDINKSRIKNQVDFWKICRCKCIPFPVLKNVCTYKVSCSIIFCVLPYKSLRYTDFQSKSFHKPDSDTVDQKI